MPENREESLDARMPFDCAAHDWTRVTRQTTACPYCTAIANLHIMWKNSRVLLDLDACREAVDA